MRKRHLALRQTVESEEPEYRFVTAKYLLRRLPGKSRALLVLGTDDLYYVVKLVGNPRGFNGLMNEFLGYELAERLGISVPKWFIMEIPAKLIHMAPSDWFEGFDQGYDPILVYHFCTQFVGTPLDDSTSDLIPRYKFHLLSNRNDFLGMLVLDIWTNNIRPRQAVFKRVGMRQQANFIDFGNILGGPENVFCDDDFNGFYFDLDVYEKIEDDAAIQSWISKIRHSVPRTLDMSYLRIPHYWYTGGHKKVRATLLERLESLELLVEPNLVRLRRMRLKYGEPDL